MARKFTAAVVALLSATWGPSALAEWELNMSPGVTEISQEIYGLHMLILWVCVGIAVVVFGAMIYSIIAHRKSLGVKPATFSHSTKAEIIWTVIPIVILVAMAVPAAETMVRLEDSRNSDMSVKITGYQWKWRYDYIDEGFGFFSNLDPASNEARQLVWGTDPAAAGHERRPRAGLIGRHVADLDPVSEGVPVVAPSAPHTCRHDVLRNRLAGAQSRAGGLRERHSGADAPDARHRAAGGGAARQRRAAAAGRAAACRRAGAARGT